MSPTLPGVYRYGTPFDKGFVEFSEDITDSEGAWYVNSPPKFTNYSLLSLKYGCVALVAFVAATAFGYFMGTNPKKDVWITGYVLTGLSIAVALFGILKSCQMSHRIQEENRQLLYVDPN